MHSYSFIVTVIILYFAQLLSIAYITIIQNKHMLKHIVISISLHACLLFPYDLELHLSRDSGTSHFSVYPAQGNSCNTCDINRNNFYVSWKYGNIACITNGNLCQVVHFLATRWWQQQWNKVSNDCTLNSDITLQYKTHNTYNIPTCPKHGKHTNHICLIDFMFLKIISNHLFNQ